jgi:DNA-binding transcriptional LysR family regulator
VVAIPDGTAEGIGRDISSALLFEDDMVIIASRRHRSFTGPLTREIYEASGHARFKMSPKNTATHQDVNFRQIGVQQHDLVMVQQFLSLPGIVEASSALALIQRRLAERFQRSHEIDILEAPFPLSPINLTAYWGRAVERDPAHAWFRGLLLQAGLALPRPTSVPGAGG